MASESVPTNADLSTLALGGFNDAALNIASYLSAQSILTLHQVNHGWNSLLNKHDGVLFERLIHQDFIEGYVLNYVAERDKLSHKKLYLAFYNRWSIPKLENEDDNTIIYIHNVRGYSESVDEKSLVFIARLGKCGGDDALYNEQDKYQSCALLQWGKGSWNGDNHQLVIDKIWNDSTDGFYFKQNQVANNQYWEGTGDIDDDGFDQLQEALTKTHTLTLHAIDIRQYQVATLMEENQMSNLEFYNPESEFWGMQGYGIEMPDLFGVPRKSSPYYREGSKGENMSISGTIECHQSIQRTVGDNGDEIEELLIIPNNMGAHREEGLTFYFGTYNNPQRVSIFLKRLMEEKCVVGERSPVIIHETNVQQPDWIQDTIVDTITSYASFEDQAGKLRLVCRQFGNSALKQVGSKLEKEELICFSGSFPWYIYKATIRNGWSEDCLTSKESAVEDALWLLKCRCGLNSEFGPCEDKESCPNKDKPLQYTRNSGETKSISKMPLIRERLMNESSFRVSQGGALSSATPCMSECSFKEEAMSIYEIYDRAHEAMSNSWQISLQSKQSFGVSGRIPTKQFIRSLYLSFVKVGTETTIADEDEEQTNKRARIARNEVIQIGEVKANSKLEGSYYPRSIKVYRFYSANNEPKEVRFEYCGSEDVDLWLSGPPGF